MNNWYPIKGWEGLYEINKNGEVRNAKNKNTIVGDINNCGYYRVSLYNQGQRKRYFRHRLTGGRAFFRQARRKRFCKPYRWRQV